MALIEALRANPGLLLIACALLGLVVGSFLNVVISRLPRMMLRDWRREAEEILREVPETPADDRDLGLWRPRSHCPRCRTPVRVRDNVPLLGWLLLRGRCRACGKPIGAQYPLVELAAAALAALCVQRFGWSPELAAALVLCWALLALAVIDWQTKLLPDTITLPLLWLGLLVNLGNTFTTLPHAVLGAAVGYGAFWLLFQLFRLITGKEGMGFGDFKLLAALGAWLGIDALLPVILISSLTGAVIGIALRLSGRLAPDNPIPFGPFLALAGLVVLFQGEAITAWWLPA